MKDDDSKTVSKPDLEETASPYSGVKHLLVPKSVGKALPTQRIRSHIKVERPASSCWFRVFPEWGAWDDDFRVFILESHGDIPSQLVEPHVVTEDIGLKIKRPTLCVDRVGELSLWLIAGGSYTGVAARSSRSSWELTAIQAAELGRTRWVRVTSNQSAGIYEIHQIQEGVEVPEPDWASMGNLGPEEILRLAFPDDRRIGSFDHPILKNLRGEF